MKKIKMIVDILLLIDTCILLDIDRSGRLLHEILGITMAVLLFIHIVLNWNWVKNVTKNLRKVNRKTKFMYLVNLLTGIIYFGAIVFGIMISNEVFKFQTASDYKLMLTHIIFGRLSIIIMFVHIGMHFRKGKNKKLRIILYAIYGIIAIASSIYSIYLLTHSFLWVMTLGGGI